MFCFLVFLRIVLKGLCLSNRFGFFCSLVCLFFPFCCRERNNLTCLNVSVSHFSPQDVVRSQHGTQDGQRQTEWGVTCQKRCCNAEVRSRHLFSTGVFLDVATQLNKGELESNLVLMPTLELRASSPQIPSPYSQHIGVALHLLWVPWDVSKLYVLFWVDEQLAGQEVHLK